MQKQIKRGTNIAKIHWFLCKTWWWAIWWWLRKLWLVMWHLKVFLYCNIAQNASGHVFWSIFGDFGRPKCSKTLAGKRSEAFWAPNGIPTIGNYSRPPGIIPGPGYAIGNLLSWVPKKGKKFSIRFFPIDQW